MYIEYISYYSCIVVERRNHYCSIMNQARYGIGEQDDPELNPITANDNNNHNDSAEIFMYPFYIENINIVSNYQYEFFKKLNQQSFL